jgi:hypothetical protein
VSTNHNNDLEKKKRIIDGIRTITEDSYEELDTAKQYWVTKFREGYPLRLTNFRNKVLATVAFIVTFLFSLHSLLGVDSLKYVFFAVIMISLSYALIIYFKATGTINKTTTVTDRLEMCYYLPQHRLFLIKGILSGSVVEIADMPISFLEDLYDFALLLNTIDLNW